MAQKQIKSITEFDEDLAAMNLRGQWQYDAQLEKAVDGPAPIGTGFHWKWSDIEPKLVEACDVFPDSVTARRNFSFINPTVPRGGSTHTLLAGMQIVLPDEVAWAHRHPIGALRFAIEGDEDVYTVVDGEKLSMCPNDLVLTPAWNWHDHHNTSSERAIWLDVLDVPLVGKLGQLAYQTYGESTQPIRDHRSDYVSERILPLRPGWSERPSKNFPLRYAWEDVSKILDRFADAEGSPYHGVLLEYVNPATGGPTLPTMACWLQMLAPGLETKSYRQTASSIFYVVEGSGTTIVGNEEIHWSQHDVVSIPAWAWHRHINDSKSDRALMFSVTDEPLIAAAGLFREEPENTLRKSTLPGVPAEIARMNAPNG